jgi:hypothetical protein
MNRYALIAVVLVGFAIVFSIAQAAAPGPEAPAGQPAPGMMMGGMGDRPMMGPMMAMMAQGDVAASGGSIYLATGPKLVKLDADLKVVASADLPMPDMPGMMGGRMGMEGMRGGNAPAAGAPQDPPAPEGMQGGMPMGGPEQMQQMMGRMAGAGVRLDADEKGVYVLAAGKLTVYSTDLKVVKSAELRTIMEQAK